MNFEKTGNYNKWTDEEICILTTNYLSLGVELGWQECCKLLPNRSRGSIREKALKLKIFTPKDNSYTELEDRFLIDNYPTLGRKLCSERLCRSQAAIQSRAQKLNIHVNPSWTTNQDELLKELYNGTNVKDIYNLFPNKTESSVKSRIHWLELGENKRWTSNEIEILKQEYPTIDLDILSKKLNRGVTAIISKASTLDIKREQYWTEEERTFLKDHYQIFGSKWCSEKLNCDIERVSSMAHKLRLILTVEQKSDIISQFDASIFQSVASPEVAYILGLIWADGSLDSKRNRVSCGLVQKDFVNVKPIFQKTGNWNFEIRCPKNRQKVELARIANINFSRFLFDNDYHIKSGASANKILSIIPDNLKHYWWRGYFDGDGWFLCTPGEKYSFGISSCLDQNWDFAIELFQTLQIKYYITKRITNRGNSSEIAVGNFPGTHAFGNYIYQRYTEDKIGLDRKYMKYQHLLSCKLERNGW